jgi:hypothetical protein
MTRIMKALESAIYQVYLEEEIVDRVGQKRSVEGAR